MLMGMSHRDRILSRRARFLAAALAGMATAASCDGEVETEDASSTASNATGSTTSGGGAQVCLSMQIGGEAGARPCLFAPEVGGGGSGGTGGN